MVLCIWLEAVAPACDARARLTRALSRPPHPARFLARLDDLDRGDR